MKNLKERLLKDNQKTQMVLKEFSVRPEWSSIHTNSDKRNNVYYERRTQYWNKHIFWRDWPCTCPLGYLLFIQKLKEKWIQFLNILFLIQPGKRWTCYKAAWKTTGSPWKLVVYLLQMWEQQDIFYRETGQVWWWVNDRIQQVPRLPQ